MGKFDNPDCLRLSHTWSRRRWYWPFHRWPRRPQPKRVTCRRCGTVRTDKPDGSRRYEYPRNTTTMESP